MAFTEFNTKVPLDTNGIIVGTSKKQEWLLPWWWMNYHTHNSFPVTFVDFGDLSLEASEWCKRRGLLLKLELEDTFMAKKEAVDPLKAKDWESMHPDIWEKRFTWYKKPFTFLLSPYKKTIWLDLDCQVRGSLAPIFELPLFEAGFGVVPENENYQKLNLFKGRTLPGQITYNSGVLVYEHESKIIKEWARQSIHLNHEYGLEQQLLVHVLFNLKLPFLSLASEYNWTVDQGLNPNAVIFHWWGNAKEAIKTQIQQLNAQGYNLTFNDKLNAGLKSTIMEFS